MYMAYCISCWLSTPFTSIYICVSLRGSNGIVTSWKQRNSCFPYQIYTYFSFCVVHTSSKASCRSSRFIVRNRTCLRANTFLSAARGLRSQWSCHVSISSHEFIYFSLTHHLELMNSGSMPGPDIRTTLPGTWTLAWRPDSTRTDRSHDHEETKSAIWFMMLF